MKLYADVFDFLKNLRQLSNKRDIKVLRDQEDGIYFLPGQIRKDMAFKDISRRKDKRHIEVDRSEAIKEYNDYMGGVDLMDRFIFYYPMNFRTKRWPVRVILHLFSLSIANSWIEYRRREIEKGMRINKVLDLLNFREKIGEELCKAELNTASFRGRPSFQSLLNYCPDPKKKSLPAILPQIV